VSGDRSAAPRHHQHVDTTRRSRPHVTKAWRHSIISVNRRCSPHYDALMTSEMTTRSYGAVSDATRPITGVSRWWTYPSLQHAEIVFFKFYDHINNSRPRHNDECIGNIWPADHPSYAISFCLDAPLQQITACRAALQFMIQAVVIKLICLFT